jgi:two-component system nitrogen regulation sensor histidine kinase NtrY
VTDRNFHIKHFILLAVSLTLFFFGFLSDRISFYSLRQYTLSKRFQEDLYSKEFQLDDLLDEWENKIDSFKEEDYFAALLEESQNKFSNEGLLLLVYRNDSLKFWSDNSLPIGSFYDESLFKDPAVFLGNGWFLKKEKAFGETRLVGLLLIKTAYLYENKFLKNEFNTDFWLPSATRITRISESRFPVYNSIGDYLFSLDFSNIPKYSSSQLYISLFCYMAGIILFLISLRILLTSIKDQFRKNIGFLLFAIILILLNAVLIRMKVPPHLGSLALFSPLQFAVSEWFSSLGDMLITSFIVFFLAYNFYLEFNLTSYISDDRKFGRSVLTFTGILLLALYFNAIVSVIYNLVIHSNIGFETYKVLNISIYTFVGLLIIAFFFAAFALFTDKFILLIRPVNSLRELFIVTLLFGLLCGTGNFITSVPFDAIGFIISILIFLILLFIRFRNRLQYTYSTFVLLVFFFTVITVYQLMVFSSGKHKSTMQVMAVDLAAEHDPIAELLLDEMDDSITRDTTLREMVTARYLDEELVYDYLARKYFNGFWDNYDLQFTICDPLDNVYVKPPVDSLFHCYGFFDQLILTSGIQIPDSKFYFIDNKSGKMSYLGIFDYYTEDSLYMSRMFLEMDSKTISGALGYPELLLAEKFRGRLESDYSSAKYYNKELITQSGNYSYSQRSEIYSSGKEEFETISLDGYNHLVYNVDNNITIIVSHPRLKLLDILISFTYIFVFFYLLVTISLLYINLPFFQKSIRLNVKNKIQYSMIAVLVFSLLLIGGGTIYFSARQFRQRQNESLSEKIQSVYVELMQKLGFDKDLRYGWESDEYRNLDELLQKFSNVFYTDINLYDPEGDILATSRPEIFIRELKGIKIDPVAYSQLVVKSRNEFVHIEHIGTLKYLSAYVPFRNNENQLLAYLNLPYFTRENILASEISNLVIAIVNFYVILITISILLAVFLSNKITRPLQMIQEKISTFTLGKTNEKIMYEARDEIGGLVREFNKMVDELARSAKLLARSERESAWREMAKQVAHEIKNPLTPMKLSVQHLERAWKDNPAEWEKTLKKITATLVEQIDELSAIATEFSNFAQMPRANNVKLELRERISDIAGLFSKTEGVQFRTSFTDKEIYVLADKEQISRMFINLVKNAIQAVPDGRKGLVDIKLETEGGYAIVKVKDNGIGIPEELGDRLFQPNFTTKSGGMGMGLAIVKSIVENAGGEIWYETLKSKGTTFIVKLPLYTEQEK